MKKLIILFASIGFFASCVSPYTQIGQINMISNRNMSDGTKYELLQKYSGSDKDALMWSKSKTITEAVDDVVAGVPGGEYLMNARIYKVGNNYFGAEGDVWGIPGQKDVAGFKVGESAVYRIGAKTEKVKILSFVNRDKISIQRENGTSRIVERNKLSTDF